jgi:predicted RNA-binding Zn-ribbon protein involved in translation (DUF1610 family)
MSSHQPIAYTYDADVHCPSCAEQHFGRCAEHGQIACDVVDSEGNEPGAMFPWDEASDPDRGEYCSDCQFEIAEPAELDCPHCAEPRCELASYEH